MFSTARGQVNQTEAQLRTWSKSFTLAPVACGKTAGTYEAMGDIKIPNKAKDMFLIGFLVLVVPEAVIAGESGFPIMRVDSEDVGLINEQFPLPRLGFTDPVATNNKALPVAAQFVPVEVVKKVNNKSFKIYFTSSATMAQDWVGFVSAIFANKPKSALPGDFTIELFARYESFAASLGRTKTDAAKAIAAANVDVGLTDITVPAKAKELTALMAFGMQNAPTAGEEMALLYTFNAGDISDFSPQEYPGCVGIVPSLGTPVGAMQAIPSRGYPVRFPLPGSEFAFSAKVRNVIILTNAPDLTHAVEFRTFEPK